MHDDGVPPALVILSQYSLEPSPFDSEAGVALPNEVQSWTSELPSF
jgi:hypothetical protein